MTDPEQAKQAPELAVLSAVAHCPAGDDQTMPVATAAIEAALGLPTDQAMLYCDLVLHSLPKHLREALIMTMQSRGNPFQSDFARKYYGKGRDEGRCEGQLSGEVRALFNVLEARGLNVDDAQRARIVGCTDLNQLDTWVRRAISVSNVDALFGEPAA